MFETSIRAMRLELDRALTESSGDRFDRAAALSVRAEKLQYLTPAMLRVLKVASVTYNEPDYLQSIPFQHNDVPGGRRENTVALKQLRDLSFISSYPTERTYIMTGRGANILQAVETLIADIDTFFERPVSVQSVLRKKPDPLPPPPPPSSKKLPEMPHVVIEAYREGRLFDPESRDLGKRCAEYSHLKAPAFGVLKAVYNLGGTPTKFDVCDSLSEVHTNIVAAGINQCVKYWLIEPQGSCFVTTRKGAEVLAELEALGAEVRAFISSRD